METKLLKQMPPFDKWKEVDKLVREGEHYYPTGRVGAPRREGCIIRIDECPEDIPQRVEGTILNPRTGKIVRTAGLRWLARWHKCVGEIIFATELGDRLSDERVECLSYRFL